MLLKKEMEVIRRMGDHLEQFDKCAQTAAGIVQAALRGEAAATEKLVSEMYRIVEEAEVAQSRIREVLYRGAFLPMIREDICILLIEVENLMRSLTDLSSLFLPPWVEMPDWMNALYAGLAIKVFRILDPIRESIFEYLKGANFIEEIRDKAETVRRMNAASAQAAHQLKKDIFACDLDPWRKTRLDSLVNGLKGVSIRAIEVASTLQRISMKMIV